MSRVIFVGFSGKLVDLKIVGTCPRWKDEYAYRISYSFEELPPVGISRVTLAVSPGVAVVSSMDVDRMWFGLSFSLSQIVITIAISGRIVSGVIWVTVAVISIVVRIGLGLGIGLRLSHCQNSDCSESYEKLKQKKGF